MKAGIRGVGGQEKRAGTPSVPALFVKAPDRSGACGMVAGPKRVWGRVRTTVREGHGNGASGEECLQDTNRVGDVDTAIVIGVVGIGAPQGGHSAEQLLKSANRISDIDTTIMVGIRTDELRRT